MPLSFSQLSNEYDCAITNQKFVIGRYREKLNKAQKEKNFKEVKRLNSLLRILYEEKSELEERAVGIKEYIS